MTGRGLKALPLPSPLGYIPPDGIRFSPVSEQKNMASSVEQSESSDAYPTSRELLSCCGDRR